MAQWQSISLMGVDITDHSTTPKFSLGQKVQCRDTASTAYGTGGFIYLKGLDATAVGSVVTFSSASWATALATANAKGRIGVAMSACVTGEYGWYQIDGNAAMKVLAAFASGNVPYLTSTAGSVDDAVVVGDEIFSALSVSAIDTPSTGLALVSINEPFVTDASN